MEVLLGLYLFVNYIFYPLQTLFQDRKDGSISIYAQHISGLTGPTWQENGVSMYYGIDGNAFLYNDEDPYKSKSKSLYLDNKSLVYWEDRRGGQIYIEGSPYITYYTYMHAC